MSDDPPPKKKSRFFANGMSVVDNILRPLKKQARKDGGGDGSTEAAVNDPPRCGTPSTEEGPPLLSNIQPLASLILPAQTATQDRNTASGSASGLPPSSLPGDNHRRGQNPQPQSHAPDSEAETEVESIADRREDGEDSDASDEENVKPDLHVQRQRHHRRQAIYGAAALLPQGSNTNVQQTFQPFSSIHTPRGVPAKCPTLADPSAPAPPGNSYTFGGVPTNPNATTAGGQFAFNFRLRQDLPVPPTIQQATSNLYEHPIGSGLARIAHQNVHTDTGPLNQHAQQDPTTPNRRIQNGVPPAAYVDMDRDEHGRRLREFVPRPTAHHGIYHPSSSGTPRLRATHPDSLIPEHMYTSPNRVEHAQQFARVNLKRKRPDAILPPASYVYQRTGSPDFNIFHGLLLYPELCFTLAAHLPVKNLISLYAISKDFHVILDTRFTTVMLRQAVAKAPESARTFMFRSYAHLCRSDPAARIAHPNAQLAEQGTPRKIPSFRWLKMVLHREKVIHELMTVFAEDGIPLPARCALALKRLWFMLDIPDNARRIGFVHNKCLMTDLDLYFSACFFTKLDMRLNDPISGEKRDGMRKLLLAQRSFTRILGVLKRELWTTRFDILREWVRMKHVVVEDDEVGLDMFGIPAAEIGRGRLEYWGMKSEEDAGRKLHGLLRPDQLIVREAIKRGMRFEKHYLRFLLYGYVRPDTLEDYAPRTYGRRIREIEDDEYGLDDLVGGVAALGVGDEGFDPLLDLGQPRETSPYTIVKEKMSQSEMRLREREDQFLEKCIEWWEEESKETSEETRGFR